MYLPIGLVLTWILDMAEGFLERAKVFIGFETHQCPMGSAMADSTDVDARLTEDIEKSPILEEDSVSSREEKELPRELSEKAFTDDMTQDHPRKTLAHEFFVEFTAPQLEYGLQRIIRRFRSHTCELFRVHQKECYYTRHRSIGLTSGQTHEIQFTTSNSTDHGIEHDAQLDTSMSDKRTDFPRFRMQMLIYALDSGSKYHWCDTKHLLKYYPMFGGKYKKIHTKLGTISRNPYDKRVREANDENFLTTSITEVIIEGPSEIPVMQPRKNGKKNESQSIGRRREPQDVVADGAISDLASDPPGQQTRYIPPGDNRREAYRLSTFEQFPNKALQVAALAKNGFVYSGYYDRVKCFSCGRTVENWLPSDNPADQKWHKTDCSFIRGHHSGNVPLGGLLGGSLSMLINRGASQPMDQSPSYSNQNTTGHFMQFSNDLTDRQRGGSYQLQPGQSVVIGPGSSQPQPYQTNPPASNPPVRRGWRMANVISADHKRHLTNLYLNREIDRLASFGRWPTGRPNIAPVALARAGFFYLGDMDRTQCFSCGGVLRNWSADDIAMDEHRTHFPNCRFVVGVERRNIPIPNQPETQRELTEKYPCRFPMNPHMRSEPSRLQTFDRRWPIRRTRATPEEIAEAGFFFLGERDRVKCWYCNGGLQNWEYDDIPWVEHAKWFPNCQFLLAKKGQLFVHEHLSVCPHLPRPIIGRQDGANVDASTATPHVGSSSSSSSSGQDVPPSAPRVNPPTPPPAIIDPQEERRKMIERIEKEMKGDAVKLVIAMGYDESLIRRTLLDKLEAGSAHDADNVFESSALLLDAVFSKEEDLKKELEEQATNMQFPSVSSNYSSVPMESMDTSASLGHTSGVNLVSGFQNDSDDEDRDLYSSIDERGTTKPLTSGYAGGATHVPSPAGGETSLKSHLWDNVPSDPESIKEFIEQKKEERLCKICFTEPADMVFIPCSHMCCCLTCTQALRTCPVCRKRIEKAIKTYTK